MEGSYSKCSEKIKIMEFKKLIELRGCFSAVEVLIQSGAIFQLISLYFDQTVRLQLAPT